MSIIYLKEKNILELHTRWMENISLNQMKLEYFYLDDISLNQNTFEVVLTGDVGFRHKVYPLDGDATEIHFNRNCLSVSYCNNLVSVRCVLTSDQFHYYVYTGDPKYENYDLNPYISECELELQLEINEFEKIFLADLSNELINKFREQIMALPSFTEEIFEEKVIFITGVPTVISEKIYETPRKSYEPKQPVTIKSSLKVLLYGIVGGILVFAFLIAIAAAVIH